jgi:YggT family protein
MFIFENLFAAIAEVLHLFLMLYIYVVIARAVVSWFDVNPNNKFINFLHRTTEPPLVLIRRYIPSVAGLDISPIILIFIIIFADRFLVGTLSQMAIY